MFASPRSLGSDEGDYYTRDRLIKVEAKLSEAELNLERIRGERDDAFKYLKLLGKTDFIQF